MKKMKTYQMAAVGLMAALCCILGPLSLTIPISPVPISLTVLSVYLCAYLLGWRLGSLSYLIYLLLGFSGLPVFSGFSGGAGKLFGPTGGYLIGFFFMAIICGICFEYGKNRLTDFLGMCLGIAVAYLFGSVWLTMQAGMTLSAALSTGALPFIPGDLIKMAITLMIGLEIRKRLNRAGIVFYAHARIRNIATCSDMRE